MRVLASQILTALFVYCTFICSVCSIAFDELTQRSSAAQEKSIFTKDMIDFLQYRVCHTPQLIGSVQDSDCNYETVNKAVAEHFHPLLEELSKLTFFRYFKVNLQKSCPYWGDDGMCSSIDCAVCECPKDEIPAKWFQMEKKITTALKLANVEQTSSRDGTTSEAPGKPCSDQTGDSDLSRINRENVFVGTNFQEWNEADSTEVWGEEDDDTDMIYINLLENVERYTGYSGYQATRIWDAIYQENCFDPSSGMCLEERVYYRLISGLQASINIHIALTYRYGGNWAPNPSLFVERVGQHPDRLQNLYFAHLFVMRALGRYREELLRYDYTTGNSIDDERVLAILRHIVLEDADTTTCPIEGQSVLSGFDEQAFFRVKRGNLSEAGYIHAQLQKKQLEIQFREKFKNVSRIMDCVSCEKCRLWGKLQVLGIGTAIKILLADDVKKLPNLQRNELIAFINVANKFARSIDGVQYLRHLEFIDGLKKSALILFFVISIAVSLTIFRKQQRNLARSQQKKYK